MHNFVYHSKGYIHPNEPGWTDVSMSAQNNVLQLVDLLLSLPASSADCERVSVWQRNQFRLEKQTRDRAVTNLMAIKLHIPDIMDFDPMDSTGGKGNAR